MIDRKPALQTALVLSPQYPGTDANRAQARLEEAIGLAQALDLDTAEARIEPLRRVEASGERLQVARSELYPRISLTGATGTATGALTDLVNGDFSVWSLVANLVQPLFQGGRLRAGIDRAEARAAEELALYANTALVAFSEVETALAAEQLLADREGFLETSAEQSRAAEDIADDRYRAGLGDYIAVLESQRLALQAEGDLISARRLRLENRVDLYLALGGGFSQPRSVSGSQP